MASYLVASVLAVALVLRTVAGHKPDDVAGSCREKLFLNPAITFSATAGGGTDFIGKRVRYGETVCPSHFKDGVSILCHVPEIPNDDENIGYVNFEVNGGCHGREQFRPYSVAGDLMPFGGAINSWRNPPEGRTLISCITDYGDYNMVALTFACPDGEISSAAGGESSDGNQNDIEAGDGSPSAHELSQDNFRVGEAESDEIESGANQDEANGDSSTGVEDEGYAETESGGCMYGSKTGEDEGYAETEAESGGYISYSYGSGVLYEVVHWVRKALMF